MIAGDWIDAMKGGMATTAGLAAAAAITPTAAMATIALDPTTPDLPQGDGEVDILIGGLVVDVLLFHGDDPVSNDIVDFNPAEGDQLLDASV